MIEQEGLEEATFLFAEDLSAIVSELRYPDFEALLNRSASIGQFAASIVRAAYVVVGEGLAIRAIVFFTFRVDEEGQVADGFNVPLRYLAKQAGWGPELGAGQPIRMACRSHCPVPWLTSELWEPEGVGDVHPALRLQKIVTRNRLGLKPRRWTIPDEEKPVQTQQALEARLEQALDQRGRIGVQALLRSHQEQLQQLTAQFRRELAQQQQEHQIQLGGTEKELQKLRQALRAEKSRSRRLQEQLRGEH